MDATFDTLYGAVAGLPIVDWHNHLGVGTIAADAPLGSLYSTWVAPDPYKHRAMRICGEPESVITGDAPESAKWEAWKRTLPKLPGNPLFDWPRRSWRCSGFATKRRCAAADARIPTGSGVSKTSRFRIGHPRGYCANCASKSSAHASGPGSCRPPARPRRGLPGPVPVLRSCRRCG